MTEENSKEERGVKYGTRPGTGQLAVPWHPSASAGRTRWPNPELRCFRRSPRSGAGVCGGDCVCDEHQARHVPHVCAHTTLAKCLAAHGLAEPRTLYAL